MLIDWFTVGAQALNFVILVWLMQRYLYKPILVAIDARETRIADELAGADAKRAEAQKDRDDLLQKNVEFDQLRAGLLSQATDEARTEHRRLIHEAKQAADAMTAKRQATLIVDARNLHQAIARRTQQEVLAIARKALADLATSSLEERIGEVFIRRLREMNGQAKSCLADALEAASAPALVRSAFELPAQQRAAIQSAFNETFSITVALRFETAPDLVSGIEVSSNGQKLAWSISDYLESLEQGIGEILNPRTTPQPSHEGKVELTSTTGGHGHGS